MANTDEAFAAYMRATAPEERTSEVSFAAGVAWAGDELATLRGRVAELTVANHALAVARARDASNRDALRAENARLREALKPFADIGIGTNPDYRPEIRLCREAIIAARTALARTEAENG